MGECNQGRAGESGNSQAHSALPATRHVQVGPVLRLRKAKGRRLLVSWALLQAWLCLPVALHAQSLNGFWRAEGYGLLLEIRDSKMRGLETTSVSCIPSWSAERRAGVSTGETAAFAAQGSILEVAAGKKN